MTTITETKDLNTVIATATKVADKLVDLGLNQKLGELKAALQAIRNEYAPNLDGIGVDMMSPEFRLYGLVAGLYANAPKSSTAKMVDYIQDTVRELREYLIQANLELESRMSEEELAEAVEPEQAQEEAEELSPEESKPLLVELEETIKAELDNAANAFIKVGAALVEARETFDSQKEFLSWVADKFDMKKSQAFNLMKVAKEFGGDERFNGVAMRVLLMFCGASSEQKEQAASLASEGKLDSKSGKAIVEPEQAESAPFDFGTQAVNVDLKTPATATQSGTEQVQHVGQLEQSAPTDNNLVDEQAELINELTNTIAELRKELQELREGKPKVKEVAQMPMLPHFQSSIPYIVLGLSDSKYDRANVKAAYRHLVRHYDEATNKEAFELITKAYNTALKLC